MTASNSSDRAPHPAPQIAPAQLTPMFAQYLEIKKEHEDCLLFYRMGDFYELFFDDAVVAAKALQITLTSRNPNSENPIPMCGVPHHSSESYVAQLLEQGYKVAICEQTEDPKAAKGLVKRSVIRVRTPGTTVEDSGLSAKGHNYLGALYWNPEKSSGGFAWIDYSTGEWSGLFSKKNSELWQWVQKMQPRELLLPDDATEEYRRAKTLLQGSTTPVRLPMRGYFDLKSATVRILEAQSIQELGAVGLNGKDELVRSCGALLNYLMQTQKQELSHLRPFRPLNLGQHLIVDEITEKNLEIFRRLDGKRGHGTLWHVLDETLTPMGGRLLEERLRHPWRELDRITSSADAVDFFFRNDHKRYALREALNQVYDLERLSTRVHLGRAVPKDLVSLGLSMRALEAVRRALESSPPGTYASSSDVDDFPQAILELYRNWDNLEDIAVLLERALQENPPPTITEGGLFKAGYNKDLDSLLDLVEHGEQRLQELLVREQQSHNLPKLKLGYNRVFGYYFELSKSSLDNVPDYFARRQTVANAERFITPELKELEDKILTAGDNRKQMEYRLFQELRRQVSEMRPRILYMAAVLAGLDFFQSLAETARKHNWVRPELHEGTAITIRQGRHPVVESMCGPSGFIANDLYLDENRRLLLITGPNMAGKSTVLRQVALIILLAQTGSFVPAAEARIGLADRIFSRVGASDNLAQGQSTFMVEMMETARILRQATKKSLVILDEIGRGTSTFDGLSLAWAVVEELVRRSDNGIRTLFATHYHELTALEGRLEGVHNMNIAIREWGGEIVFLRRLVPGPSDRSYGIEVAKLAGVPGPVVLRAKKILETLEASRTMGGQNSGKEAMQKLLPGLDPSGLSGQDGKKDKAKDAALLPPVKKDVPHPFFVVLRDLNTDNLTPMQALALVNEWKVLWGDKGKEI